MATVQISFTDASDNEDFFTVYRSASNGAVTGAASEEVAKIEWDSVNTQWDCTPLTLGTSAAFVGATPTSAPSNVAQQFTIQYTESNAGTYVYGVEAENSIGKSAITSSSSITIT